MTTTRCIRIKKRAVLKKLVDYILSKDKVVVNDDLARIRQEKLGSNLNTRVEDE
jgi:hypothetical protein